MLKQLNDREKLMKYYKLWHTGYDDFFGDMEFISFAFHFDINKHTRKTNNILYFLIGMSLNKYINIAYEVYINDMIDFYINNDDVLFIPTGKELKHNALNHIQTEYKRVIEEHPLFKRTKEIRNKYNIPFQEELKIYGKDYDPFYPQYLIPEAERIPVKFV
jgi:predicted DNA-binding protein